MIKFSTSTTPNRNLPFFSHHFLLRCLVLAILLLCCVASDAAAAAAAADDDDDEYDENGGTCEQKPFNIVVTLEENSWMNPIRCSEDDSQILAEIIAENINHMLIDVGEVFGVTRSRTRICKEGQIITEQSAAGTDGSDDNPDRHFMRNRHLGKDAIHKFVFRGTGSCMICYRDDKDARLRELLSTTKSKTNAFTSSVKAISIPKIDQGNDKGIGDRLRGVTETFRNISQRRHITGWQHNPVKQYDSKTNKHETQGGKREETRRELAYRRKSTADFLAALQSRYDRNKDFSVEFYKNKQGLPRYQFSYDSTVFDYDIVAELLSTILTFKLNIDPSSSNLCTFGYTENVYIELIETERFGVPSCP